MLELAEINLAITRFIHSRYDLVDHVVSNVVTYYLLNLGG